MIRISRDNYQDYYAYGATGFRNSSEEFHQTRFQNLENFLNANPGLIVHDNDTVCGHVAFYGSRHRCGIKKYSRVGVDIPCQELYNKLELWNDHVHSMRFKGERNTTFLISHPYNNDEHIKSRDFDDIKMPEGLVVHYVHGSNSWYCPPATLLCFIGRLDVLERLNHDWLRDHHGEVTEVNHIELSKGIF